MVQLGRLTRYQALTIITVVLTLALVAVGALVRTSGSGLGCPDWPLCHGQLVPPLERTAIIEYSHRSLAAIVGVMIVATSAATLLSRKRDRAARWLAIAVVPLLGFQAYLGKVTVELELPPEVVAVHLSTALLLLSILASIAAFAVLGEQRSRLYSAERAGYLRIVTVVMAIEGAVLLIGAYVVGSGSTFACTTWPGCAQAPIPFVDGGLQQSIHWLHRLSVLVGFAGVAWLRFAVDGLREPAAGLRFGANAALGLFVLQIGIGALNIFTAFTPVVLTAHLFVAAAIWVTLVLMLVAGRYAAEPAPASNPYSPTSTARVRLESRG